MWRSDKDKAGKPVSRVLPSSSQQLAHAKADRARKTSLFRDLTAEWRPVVRKPVEVEAPPIDMNDPNLPAYLRHRPTSSNGPKLFFRTKVNASRKKPK
jgi:hypothetical protein